MDTQLQRPLTSTEYRHTRSPNIFIGNDISRACLRLSLNEMRLVFLATKNIPIGTTVLNNPMVYVHYQNLMDRYGMDALTAKRTLQLAVIHLSDRWIRFTPEAGKGETSPEDMRWITSKVPYAKGRVGIKFNGDLLDRLFLLQRDFTSMELEYIGRFTSKYTAKLFQVLKSWMSEGGTTLSLEDLHFQLDTPDALRANFKDLRKRVLEVAAEEITEKTNYVVAFEPVKEGRAVKSVAFTINLKVDALESSPEETVLGHHQPEDGLTNDQIEIMTYFYWTDGPAAKARKRMARQLGRPLTADEESSIWDNDYAWAKDKVQGILGREISEEEITAAYFTWTDNK